MGELTGRLKDNPGKAVQDGQRAGLGLPMSHDIVVKQRGGTIDVDPLPGEFTELTIVLPRTINFSNKTKG